MKRAGAPASLIAKFEQKDEPFLLHPKNRKPLRLFMAMQTQWHTEALSTMSSAKIIRTGLDYNAIGATAKLMGIRCGKSCFTALRIMENEAQISLAQQS